MILGTTYYLLVWPSLDYTIHPFEPTLARNRLTFLSCLNLLLLTFKPRPVSPLYYLRNDSLRREVRTARERTSLLKTAWITLP